MSHGDDTHPDGSSDRLSSAEEQTLRAIATYQFGPEVGVAFVEATPRTNVIRSRSGRFEQLYVDGDRLSTVTTNGLLTLGIAAAEIIQQSAPFPANRIVVSEEAEPFVVTGENVFAKFIKQVDPLIRPYDEVLVVDGDDRALAVGRAEMGARDMIDFQTGMAVAVRAGIT